MAQVILTSSFSTVARELRDKEILPASSVRVAFIPTAGDPYDSTPWIDADRNALLNLGYTLTDIDLKGTAVESLLDALRSHEIIFVAGGNTTYLAHHSSISGFGAIIRALLSEGKIYIGSSAGSILAGPSVEPFIAEDLPELGANFKLNDSSCLGLVDYIALPHYAVAHEVKDAMEEKYAGRFRFVKMTDHEYRVESI